MQSGDGSLLSQDTTPEGSGQPEQGSGHSFLIKRSVCFEDLSKFIYTNELVTVCSGCFTVLILLIYCESQATPKLTLNRNREGKTHNLLFK